MSADLAHLVGVSADAAAGVRLTRASRLGRRRAAMEMARPDAYRHTYASVLIASAFGEEFPRQLTTAHEARPGNPAAREAMDLYDEVGRRIAAERPRIPPSTWKSAFKRAVEEGEVLVIDRDGRLAFSDQVPLDETGEATPDRRPGRPLEQPDEVYDPGYGVKG